MLDVLQPFTQGFEERDASSSTATAWCGHTHEVVEEQSHHEKFPSVATDTGRETLAKDTKSKKGVIGSQPRGNHNVFTRQKQHEPGAWMGLHLLSKFRGLDHGRSPQF